MAADPKRSAGARTERAAFRAYLRRALKREPKALEEPYTSELQFALYWVLNRQKRYDKRAGGLGRK
jgi:hypothetical protein